MNTKTKHTPGPWIDDGHDGKDTQIVNSKWGAVAHVIYNGDCSQRVANARLIAAAPELLQALEDVILDWETQAAITNANMPSISTARAAIAKATGKE